MADEKTLPTNRAAIGKWSVDRYVDLIKRWVIGAGILLALCILTQRPNWLVIILEALVVIIIGWRVARRNGGKVEGLAAGMLLGATLGFVASLCRYILNPTLHWGLNIIIETIITAIVAALVAVSVTISITLFQQSKH